MYPLQMCAWPMQLLECILLLCLQRLRLPQCFLLCCALQEEEPKWEGYTDAGIDYDEQTQADYEPGSAAGRYDADGTLQKLGRRRKRHAAAAGKPSQFIARH